MKPENFNKAELIVGLDYLIDSWTKEAHKDPEFAIQGAIFTSFHCLFKSIDLVHKETGEPIVAEEMVEFLQEIVKDYRSSKKKGHFRLRKK